MRPAHGKRRWRPVQAGRPCAGAIPKPATQGRLRRPAPTDRPPESTAGNTNSPRPPAGTPGKPTAAPAASPTARGEYRTSTAPAHGGLPGAGTAAIDSTVLARSSRSGSIRFPLRRREPELEPKAGEGGCRRGCPRPVPHSRNPGERNARPRTRYPRHPAIPTRTLTQQCAQDAGRRFGLHRAQGLDRRPRTAREPDCPRHGTKHGRCWALRRDRRRTAAGCDAGAGRRRARWKRTTPCPAG